MIRKVCSNKLNAVVSIVGILICAIYELFNGLMSYESMLLKIIMSAAILPFLLLGVFVGNRLAYIVTYDANKNMLYRKGLFFGYKYQLKVEDIKEFL